MIPWIVLGLAMVCIGLFYVPATKTVVSPGVRIRGRLYWAKFRLYRRLFMPRRIAIHDPGGSVYTFFFGPFRLVVLASRKQEGQSR